jgi:hypothetical protein
VHRHETDVTSLVAGLVFAGIAGVWALIAVGALTPSMLPVAIPVVLLVVGVVGVVAAVIRSRREGAAEAD